jgi:hypothetical protein
MFKTTFFVSTLVAVNAMDAYTIEVESNSSLGVDVS